MRERYGPCGTVDEPEPRRRNRGLYVAAATAVVVLAAIGGTAGYVLAGKDDGLPVANSSAAPTTSAPAVTASASSEPSGVAGSLPPGVSFPLPNVSGQDFEKARRQLRDLRLGVTVIFGSSGDDRRVERTEPAVGQPVWPGKSVNLYVFGRAPMATVPGVVGLACDEAGRVVADHGLTPQYPDGHSGRVLRQDPAPSTDTLRWNDQVHLYCGAASPGSGPTPGPTSG
jgi:hypothetical protein